MKKTLVILLTACVLFGTAAAFAQPGDVQNLDGNGHHNWQPRMYRQGMMNLQGQRGEFCAPNGNENENCDGNFDGKPGFCHQRNGHFGHRGMNFTPDMPKEIREKAAELAKLRVDLEEAMSSRPVNKEKALDTYAKMQKLEQEIKMWRFSQRLERIEEFKKQMEEKKPAPQDDAQAK